MPRKPAPSPMPGEFALIARYFAPLAQGFPGAAGLRDDVAAIAPSPGYELVLKSDAIVAGIDFPPDEAPGLIARKALRVNLSDLAAKGAAPRAYLLDLMLPEGIGEAWIAAFAAGLAQDQAEFGVHLIGGDMSGTPGPVAVAVMAIGEAPAGRIVRRSGARAGDRLYVSGTIGDSALGLAVVQGRLKLDDPAAAFLADRYRLPRPRVTLGASLIGLATGAIDVSDGLVADLRHLCEAAGLDAVVEAPLVPLSAAARAALAVDPALLPALLTGGDDYEILFAASPDKAGEIAALSRELRLDITAIGNLMPAAAPEAPRVTVRDATGRPLALGAEGWTHFGC